MDGKVGVNPPTQSPSSAAAEEQQQIHAQETKAVNCSMSLSIVKVNPQFSIVGTMNMVGNSQKGLLRLTPTWRSVSTSMSTWLHTEM